MGRQASRAGRRSSVRLAAEPGSVPGARRFVRDGLRELGHHELVDDAAGRRRVWAVLVPDEEVGPVRPPDTGGQAGAEITETLPDGWKLVVVPRAPVDLSVRIDTHIDDVIRELQLIDSSPRSPSAELADLIQRLLSAPFARHAARAQVLEALEAGLDRVDVRLPLPREAAPDVRALLVTMRAADRLCRDHQMLGVPATAEMDRLREWFTHNMVTQLEDDADPLGWEEWLAGRGTR